jgi:hypothetical protein
MTRAIVTPEAIRPTHAEVRALVDAPPALGASIYVPMNRALPDSQENAPRLRRLLLEAVHRVRELKHLHESARSLTQELLRIMEEGAHEFGSEREDGLAVFIRPGLLKVFKATVRFDEHVWIASRFVVTPMLEYLQGNGRFFVLAASQNNVRLLQGNKHFIWELEVHKLPTNLVEALRIDEHIRSTQFHTAAPGGRQSIKRGGGLYHGHSGDELDKSDDIVQFLRRLDDALCKFWRDERAPLVFAGVDYLHSMFRECNHYNHLVDEPVTGNPEHWDLQQLNAGAWAIVESRFDAARRQAVEKYGTLAARGRGSDNLTELSKWGRYGRIDTLLVQRHALRLGVIDSATGAITQSPADATEGEDLLDFLASLTLGNSGTVYLMNPDEMPTASPAAGTYRY